MKRYVLTGAPGAGKTSVLRVLQEQGFAVVEEAATDVISCEQRRGVAEPWRHVYFIDKVTELQRQLQQEPVAGDALVQVHDRSPLCTLALARYLGHPVTPLLAGEVNKRLPATANVHSSAGQEAGGVQSAIVCPVLGRRGPGDARGQGPAGPGLGFHQPGRRLRGLGGRAPQDDYSSVTSSSALASSSRWGPPAACLPRFFGLKSPETPSPTAPAAPAIAPPTPFTAVSACGSSGTPSPSRSTLRNGRVTTSAALATPVPTATAPVLTPAPTAFAASLSASSALFGSLSAFSGFAGPSR